MQTIEIEIGRIVETIWTAFLELGVVPIDPAHARAMERGAIAGVVHISGAWYGSVVLHCTMPLARHATGILFRIDSATADATDVEDALGELANQTGGNVKALMPEPCQLSLPVVVPSADVPTHLAGARLVSEVAYECLGEPFRVEVYERQ